MAIKIGDLVTAIDKGKNHEKGDIGFVRNIEGIDSELYLYVQLKDGRTIGPSVIECWEELVIPEPIVIGTEVFDTLTWSMIYKRFQAIHDKYTGRMKSSSGGMSVHFPNVDPESEEAKYYDSEIQVEFMAYDIPGRNRHHYIGGFNTEHEAMVGAMTEVMSMEQAVLADIKEYMKDNNITDINQVPRMVTW
jgi:hypothetical protein